MKDKKDNIINVQFELHNKNILQDSISNRIQSPAGLRLIVFWSNGLKTKWCVFGFAQ